jgi:hypothetical protein
VVPDGHALPSTHCPFWNVTCILGYEHTLPSTHCPPLNAKVPDGHALPSTHCPVVGSNVNDVPRDSQEPPLAGAVHCPCSLIPVVPGGQFERLGCAKHVPAVLGVKPAGHVDVVGATHVPVAGSGVKPDGHAIAVGSPSHRPVASL